MGASNFFRKLRPLSQFQPKRQTNERGVIHEPTWWLDVYGDDQETQRDPRETTMPRPRRNTPKPRRQHRIGLSAGQVRTVHGRGFGLSAVCAGLSADQNSENRCREIVLVSSVVVNLGRLQVTEELLHGECLLVG